MALVKLRMPLIEMKTDLENVKLVVNHAHGIDLAAYVDGICIGRALSILDGKNLKLCDIRLERFARKGVGTLMLERLILEADRAGVVEISGSVMSEDLEKSPFLTQWYTRHGFTVTDAPPDHPEGAKKCISRISRRAK